MNYEINVIIYNFPKGKKELMNYATMTNMKKYVIVA